MVFTIIWAWYSEFTLTGTEKDKAEFIIGEKMVRPGFPRDENDIKIISGKTNIFFTKPLLWFQRYIKTNNERNFNE